MTQVQLYLASGSPRRQALLKQLGISYRLLEHGVVENRTEGEAAEDFVRRLALDKALAAQRLLQVDDPIPVLAADTIVICRNRILGKPDDRDQALQMLQWLSGDRHEVMTAVAVANRKRSQVILSTTEVTFREVRQAEILAYWDTGEPRDKAGAYAIQGLGSMFIKAIKGSYSAVVGLPVFETVQLLSGFGLGALRIMQGQRQ